MTTWDDEKLYSDKNDFPQSREGRRKAICQIKLKRIDTGIWDTVQTGVEYLSPNQQGGIYGTIYRTYFTTSLPASLTSGNNISKLMDYVIHFNDTSNRNVGRGYTETTGGVANAQVVLSGASGNGNLALSSTGTWVIDSGWVDYCK